MLLGQEKLSSLVRCPDFRGHSVTKTGHFGQLNVSCLSGCPYFQSVMNKGFHFSCFLSPPPHSDQDPESRESILEGLPTKKDTFSLDPGKLPKIRSSQPSATFNSYLTNPEQVPIK